MLPALRVKINFIQKNLIKNIISHARKMHFEKNGIVPDVIDLAPVEIAKVNYSTVSASLGNILTPTEVKDRPSVEWKAETGVFYTLCMTDPDAPSRQTHEFREWHHWLVGNIPESNIAKGEVLSDYIGSGPPPETGLHRYVFLIYKQPKKLMFDEEKLTSFSGKNRGGFKIQKFATKYNLILTAGNFFQAEYDDYVPILYKQLGA